MKRNCESILKCAIIRLGCKGTARLNRGTNLITHQFQHDHSVEEYKSDVHDLKTKCETVAMHSQDNPRQVFNETTRSDPRAFNVSFTECESAMDRASRKLQPKIPLVAS